MVTKYKFATYITVEEEDYVKAKAELIVMLGELDVEEAYIETGWKVKR